jgi:hypothetical protein
MNEEHPLQKQINVIQEDVKELKSDVKDLLKYKFQIIGGVAMLTFVVSLAFNLWKVLGK